MKLRKRFPLLMVVLVLSALVILSIILSITFGAVSIPALDVAKIVWYGLIGSDSPEAVQMLNSARGDIIWSIRMPRVLLSAVVGAGLALSGVAM